MIHKALIENLLPGEPSLQTELWHRSRAIDEIRKAIGRKMNATDTVARIKDILKDSKIDIFITDVSEEPHANHK